MRKAEATRRRRRSVPRSGKFSFAPCSGGGGGKSARLSRREWGVAESSRQISRMKTSRKDGVRNLRRFEWTHPSSPLAARRSAPLSPPLPTAPPPRRYMNTQQSFESPSLSLDLSPREFLSGDVLAYLLTRMMCPSSMLFSCITLNDSLLHINSPKTFTCTQRIEVKVEPSARLIKSPRGVSDRAESF